MKKSYFVGMFLIIIFTAFSYKVNAEIKYPSIVSVALDHSPLVEGDTENFYVVSDYDGPVQYKVKIESLSTSSTVSNSTSSKSTTVKPAVVEYGDIVDGKYPIKINVSTKYKVGKYKAVVYVKRAGETGRYENSDCDYDSFYNFNLNCVNKDDAVRVYANGNMDIAKSTYKLGESIVINGIKNIKGMQKPYKYKLHVFDIKNNKWIKDITGYQNSIEWRPDRPGDYIIDIWATSSNSKAKYESWKVVPVTVLDDFKVDYIKALNPSNIVVKFNDKPKLTDIQNKANYYISTSEIDSIKLLNDNRSVQLKLKKSIMNETLYFVNLIRNDADSKLVTEPYTSIERYTDTTVPYVKQIICSNDKARIIFSEPMKTIGNASVVQGDFVKDISSLLNEGDSEISVDIKDFSPNENISFVAVGAKDMFDNPMSPDPNTIYFKKDKSDYTKPTVTSIKPLSTTMVQITFSERLKTLPIVTVGTKPVQFDYDLSPDNKVFTGVMSVAYSKVPVKVISYRDMSGNEGDVYQKDVEFDFDNTLPKLLSSEVKTFNNKLYLVLHFDEFVKSSIIQYVEGNYTVNAFGEEIPFDFSKEVRSIPYSKSNGTSYSDGKSVMIDISDNNKFPEGEYKLTIPAGFVKDVGEYKNDSQEGTAQFVKESYSRDKSKPFVNNDPVIDSDYSYIDIPFSEEMDEKSALTLENYKVNNVCIFNKAKLLSDNEHIRLYIASNLINYSGDRMLEISGVKDEGGNVMERYRKIINLRENKKPFIDYAVVEGKTVLRIAFNETVKNIEDDDFSVYINGSVADGHKISMYCPTYTKQVWLYFDSSIDLSDRSNTVQVKVNGNNITDLSDNYMDYGALVEALK